MATKRKRPSTRKRTDKKPKMPRSSLPQGCSPADKLAALEQLAAEEGTAPIENPNDLVADFWPEDETADEIVAAIRTLRREGK